MSQFPHHHRNHLRLLEVVQALQTLPNPPTQAIPDAFLGPARRQLIEKPPTRSTLSAMLGKVVEEGCVASGVVMEESVYIGELHYAILHMTPLKESLGRNCTIFSCIV